MTITSGGVGLRTDRGSGSSQGTSPPPPLVILERLVDVISIPIFREICKKISNPPSVALFYEENCDPLCLLHDDKL